MVDAVCRVKAGLTATEEKVLELVRLGLTNREIALHLCRSEFTIKTHVEHILAKLGARNRMQACRASISEPAYVAKNTPDGVFVRYLLMRNFLRSRFGCIHFRGKNAHNSYV